MVCSRVIEMLNVRWWLSVLKKGILVFLLLYVVILIVNKKDVWEVTSKSETNYAYNLSLLRIIENRLNTDVSNYSLITSSTKFEYNVKYKGKEITIDDIFLDERFGSFEEKLNFLPDIDSNKKYILSAFSDITNKNLGGCPEWNCEIVNDNSFLSTADAVILSSLDESYDILNPNTIISVLTQESPAHDTIFHSRDNSHAPQTFIGFRFDSNTSSPYGYTVHLSKKSQLKAIPVNYETIKKKNKPISWMVSHCNTPSKRESYVSHLQKYIQVDIFGACGNKECLRENNCNDVDEEYYFYLAFENSICQDYVTEKLWYRGFHKPIIPIVMKRSIVEKYVPPKSFIAIDDFYSPKELSEYLNRLIKDQDLYLSYFEWMKEYAVIFLDGSNHESTEKPWGFCQLCRLLHQKKTPIPKINDFSSWWYGSCEYSGELVNKLLKNDNVIVNTDDNQV